MNMRATLASALCLALLSTGAHAVEKRLDRTFEVQPGGKLTVDTDGSDVTVRGTDANQVVVHIVANGSQGALDRLSMSAEASSEGVAVVSKRSTRDWLSWLRGQSIHDSRITISVPKRYHVNLRSSGGNLELAQLQGDATGKTSGGDIRVGDVTGNVRMHTSGGDIDAANVRGDIDIHTSGGDIVARAITGKLTADTSGGDIRLQQIEGPTRAHTSSGNVVADSIQGDLDLQSSGGSISAANVDGRIRAVTSGGNIDTELAGANRGIDASTSGGNIVLRLPRNTAATLNASTSGGSVSSDLPVTTVATSSGSRSRNLRGAINGGGESIRAHTSGGDIRVRVKD